MTMPTTQHRSERLPTSPPATRVGGVIQLPVTVYEAALTRIRWLWEEFEGNVHVSTSGGKDSTVVMELAAAVAREHSSRLKVHWLDQEAEWQGTRDYVRELKDSRDDLEVEWYQLPFRFANNTAYGESWGRVWDPNLTDAEYVRPREPDTIHENPFRDRHGEVIDRFGALLEAINNRDGGVTLTGLRADEAPSRRAGVLSRPAYKWATWGRRDPGCYLMHPVYDWSYKDVWKAIHDHGWSYNRVYDEMYRYGVPTINMRVSGLTHVEAMRALNWVQEIEPETWLRLTQRFTGINSYSHVGEQILEEYLDRRPHVFDSDAEYREHLIDRLIPPDHQQPLREAFDWMCRDLPWMTEKRIHREIMRAIIRSDSYENGEKGTALVKFVRAGVTAARKWEMKHGEKLPPRSLDAYPRV